MNCVNWVSSQYCSGETRWDKPEDEVPAVSNTMAQLHVGGNVVDDYDDGGDMADYDHEQKIVEHTVTSNAGSAVASGLVDEFWHDGGNESSMDRGGLVVYGLLVYGQACIYYGYGWQ